MDPRTRELADLLSRVIEEYEKHHPSVTGSEVRAALQMAARSSRTATPPAAVVVGLGLVLLLGVFLVFFNVGSPSGGAIPWNAVVMVVASVLAVAILIKRLAGK